MKHHDIHHFTEDLNDPCPSCGAPRLWGWDDAEEKNGRSEARYDVDEVCADCYEERHGRKPRTLREIAQERQQS